MPRPRPPHLHRETTRHGRAVWYVRVGKGPRIRIKSPYGTPDFDADYSAAVSGEAVSRPAKAQDGSLQWLYDRYRETTVWSNLSIATRRQRENIFRHVMKRAGTRAFRDVNRASILAGIEERSRTPAQARHFLEAMRGMFRWALGKHVKVDPTVGIPTPRGKTKGFPAWTEEDVAAYEAHWPLGTRQRVWLDVLLYTGLRLGDAVLIGRQHVRDGVAALTTEKTGTPVYLPILPVLEATLRIGPCGDLAFICGARGAPFTKESFGNEFSEAARAAGIPKSAHGVRKIAATRAAENGATVAELEAIFGWSGGRMASLYTRSADRKRLARGAMDKMTGTKDEILFPHPKGKVRGVSQKTE